ncbi:hypothetical protein GQ44DRAFT_12914 [Phaeosphaeriaceae sp. PMI808]|nr:hypothetical protein GQ44DRAFT_12914 [Phaeosphaeriaceae sp. PMI808]
MLFALPTYINTNMSGFTTSGIRIGENNRFLFTPLDPRRTTRTRNKSFKQSLKLYEPSYTREKAGSKYDLRNNYPADHLLRHSDTQPQKKSPAKLSVDLNRGLITNFIEDTNTKRVLKHFVDGTNADQTPVYSIHNINAPDMPVYTVDYCLPKFILGNKILAKFVKENLPEYITYNEVLRWRYHTTSAFLLVILNMYIHFPSTNNLLALLISLYLCFSGLSKVLVLSFILYWSLPGAFTCITFVCSFVFNFPRTWGCLALILCFLLSNFF